MSSNFNTPKKIQEYAQGHSQFSWDHTGKTIAANEFKVSNGVKSTTVLVPDNPGESDMRKVMLKVQQYFDFFETFYPPGSKS